MHQEIVRWYHGLVMTDFSHDKIPCEDISQMASTEHAF